MAAITFDTLKFTQMLETSGVERAHAAAIATAVRDSHETAELATKSDIRDTKTAIRELELRMEAKFAALQAEMTSLKWMSGAVIAGVLSLMIRSFF